MSNNTPTENSLFSAADMIRSYGFADPSSMIDLLYRVVKTKQVLKGDDDINTVYRTMQDVSSSLPRFPGDAELFYNIFKVLSTIDDRGILSFINIASDGRELYAPDVLTEKFSEYVDEQTKSILVA